MKHIKLFEEWNTEFKDGNYITYNVDVSNNGIKILTANKPYELIKVDNIDHTAWIMCDNGKLTGLPLNSTRVKKISDEEAKILLNAEKYNL